MSEFAERLNYLLFEQKINAKTFARTVKISESCISDYLQGIHLPTVANLVKIADFFNRSVDFLLGREEENANLTFKPCPPFCERLEFLLQRFDRSSYFIYSGAGIPKSVYYDWKCGKRQPAVENIIKLADLLECRIDYVLGRES